METEIVGVFKMCVDLRRHLEKERDLLFGDWQGGFPRFQRRKRRGEERGLLFGAAPRSKRCPRSL